MTKHFYANPGFRAAKAALNRSPEQARKLAGPAVVIDGNELDVYVQLMLQAQDRIPNLATFLGPEVPVQQHRQALEQNSRLALPRAKQVNTQDLTIPGIAGPIGVRIYRAHNLAANPPVLLYFHGGGFVVGSLDTHDANCRMLARITRAMVISVDYRLAPESPFPAAVEDGFAAYQWAVSADLGAQPKVAVMGDSAGGNLAAAVCLKAREEDVQPPIAQGLVYPVTDWRMGTVSHRTFAEGYFLSAAQMHFFRDHYVPQAQWLNPLASPLLADDHSDLPPARIWTAGFDPLRDEGELYFEELADAGVPVELRMEPSMVHGFFGMGMLPGGLERISFLAREMSELLWSNVG